ncbi:hypothetical protein AC578_10232 [Pseudocercospora eumusae]|uniref:Uncharacterized protein n=1 Tax=Pseudocercospora eumusae TaxID=321146 RepID=A0A139HYN6_9PEZI|nr:hypothetical protein AC578_10232 [Pseudocercospora eumusae]
MQAPAAGAGSAETVIFGTRAKEEIEKPSELRLAGNEMLKSERVLGVKREILPATVQKLAEKRDSGHLNNGLSRSSSQRPNYTSLHLLETYKQLRLAEELPLNFDYISFWISSFQLLQKLRAAIAHLVDEQSVSLDEILVHFVLLDAAAAARHGKSLSDSALGAVAKVLGGYIEKNGGVLMTEAKRRARGYVLQDKEEEEAGSLQ